MVDLVDRTLLGRYRIEQAIGRGGMAEVYKAWDNQRNYHVAIKVLREDLAEDREFDRRFRREAEALARLAHRNIVRFYGFERAGHLAFIVMDYVEGTTLRRRIFDADGPLPVDEVLSVMEQVALALHYAHAQGVLHRDVKPGNIMIQPDGQALVTDFGIAKAADAATMTAVMPGTPAYMSPEQCRSEPLDVRTDVYSLGIVAYEMLTGRRPFVGDIEGAGTGSTGERIRWEQMHARPLALRRLNPALSPLVETVVLRALAKDLQARFATVIEFWEALQAVLGPTAVWPEEQARKAELVAPKPVVQKSASAQLAKVRPRAAVEEAKASKGQAPVPSQPIRYGNGGWALTLFAIALVLFVVSAFVLGEADPDQPRDFSYGAIGVVVFIGALASINSPRASLVGMLLVSGLVLLVIGGSQLDYAYPDTSGDYVPAILGILSLLLGSGLWSVFSKKAKS